MQEEKTGFTFSFFAPMLGPEANDALSMIEDLYEERVESGQPGAYLYGLKKGVEGVIGYQWRSIKRPLFEACFTLAKPNKADGRWDDRYEWQISYGIALLIGVLVPLAIFVFSPDDPKASSSPDIVAYILSLCWAILCIGGVAAARKEFLPLALCSKVILVSYGWFMGCLTSGLGFHFGGKWLIGQRGTEIAKQFYYTHQSIMLDVILFGGFVAAIPFLIETAIEQISFRLHAASPREGA